MKIKNNLYLQVILFKFASSNTIEFFFADNQQKYERNLIFKFVITS